MKKSSTPTAFPLGNKKPIPFGNTPKPPQPPPPPPTPGDPSQPAHGTNSGRGKSGYYCPIV